MQRLLLSFPFTLAPVSPLLRCIAFTISVGWFWNRIPRFRSNTYRYLELVSFLLDSSKSMLDVDDMTNQPWVGIGTLQSNATSAIRSSISFMR